MEIFNAPPLQTIINLLSKEGLPTQDLSLDSTIKFFGCGDVESPDGVIGLEIHGKHGLLRSLVVTKVAQNSGYGKALVQRVEAQAQSSQLEDIYLLTETAEEFFKNLGYTVCNRHDVAAPIQNTAEFSELCPDSAVVMIKRTPISNKPMDPDSVRG